MSPGNSQTWRGLGQIRARYHALARFTWLRHFDAEVEWMPDNSRATRAIVRAQTAGVIAPSAGSPKAQYIHGDEVWAFARLGGKWLITSFTYNVCYGRSGGG